MSILKSILNRFGSSMTRNINTDGPSQRQLIEREARIGRQLFGPIPKNHRREFFCLDDHTWIWYEEWIDKTGQRQFLNTRYEIRENGILKIQGDRHYVFIGEEETQNLLTAVKLYYHYVITHVYNLPPRIAVT